MSPVLFPVDFQLCSLSSGSSGNSFYAGSSSHGILIDAGISARRIRKTLEEIGVGLDGIQGVFITHNHIDHISALTLLSKKHKLPVYCSEGTWKGILRNRMTFDVDQTMYRPLGFDETVELTAGGTSVKVTMFPVSHDAHEASGFFIESSGRKLVIATDLGAIGPEVAHFLKQADAMVIESNYDEHMLMNGRYPEQLKQRVHSSLGHMCNLHTSDFLAENYHPGITHILLGHLSAENNTPELALNTLHNTFAGKGVTIHQNTVVKALPRGSRSEIFVLEKK